MDNYEVSEKSYVARDVQPTVLRLHPDVRAELVRLAHINGRSLSKEIATRLDVSLKTAVNTQGTPPSYSEAANPTHHTTAHSPATPAPLNAKEKGPADPLTETDRAMLGVFRRMPVEKQLALLSLFK
jgi:hypothetical protein